MEEALQQNETVEKFADAFARVGDEDSAVGQKGDNDLKELRTFNDINIEEHVARKHRLAPEATGHASRVASAKPDLR